MIISFYSYDIKMVSSELIRIRYIWIQDTMLSDVLFFFFIQYFNISIYFNISSFLNDFLLCFSISNNVHALVLCLYANLAVNFFFIFHVFCILYYYCIPIIFCTWNYTLIQKREKRFINFFLFHVPIFRSRLLFLYFQ